MKKKVKQCDKFGHKVELNFNKNGNEHKTILGGIVSVIIMIFTFTFVTYEIQKLVTNGDDKVTSVTKFMNQDEIENV